MKIEMNKPTTSAMVGTQKGFICHIFLMSWVIIITTGTATTASQKFVCMSGKCSIPFTSHWLFRTYCGHKGKFYAVVY